MWKGEMEDKFNKGKARMEICDENDWCWHIFRESNKAADTHANWFGPGAQWMAPDLHEKMQKSRHIVLSFDGARREAGLVRLLGFFGYGMSTVHLRKSPMVDVC